MFDFYPRLPHVYSQSIGCLWWSWESCRNFPKYMVNVLSLMQKPSPGVTFDLPSIDSTLPVPDTTFLTAGPPAPQPSSTAAGVHTVHVSLHVN